MAFSESTFSKATFKFALGLAHTSNSREFYSEEDVSSFVIASQNIWAEEIDKIPATAFANGIVSDEIELRLEKIPGYNSYHSKLSGVVPASLVGKKNPLTGLTYAPNDRVGHIIPRLISDDYLAELRDPNISPSSPNNIISYGHSSNWFLDPFAGIITQENELVLTVDSRLVCRIYTGEFLSERMDRIQLEIDTATISGGSVTPAMLVDLENDMQTQIDSLSASLDSVAQGDVTTSQLIAVSAALDSRIDDAFSESDSNLTLIKGITANVQVNADDIDILELAIDNILISGGAVTPSDISALQAQVDDLDTDITSLSGSIDATNSNISGIQNDISDLVSEDINLQNQITANVFDIVAISGKLGPGLDTVDSRITSLSASVDQNTIDIATNASTISSVEIELSAAIISGGSVSQLQINELKIEVESLSGAIDANSDEITTLSSSISANNDLIVTNQLNISTNTNLIGDNTTEIDNLKIKDITLTNSISGNQNDISILETDILNMSGAVVQNSSDITQNTLAISQLQIDLDLAVLSGGGGTTDLTAIELKLATISGDVQDNTTLIYTLSGDVSSNQSNITQIQIDTSNQGNDLSDLTVLVDTKADITTIVAISASLKDDYQTQIDAIVISGGFTGLIGPAEDGSYEDGLFPFQTTTPVGHAIDKFNELMLLFAPPSPPELGSMSSNLGEIGKVGYDAATTIGGYDPDSFTINQIFNTTSPQRGIFDGSGTFQGTLADDVSAHAFSYIANSFKDGDQGTLQLSISGDIVHTVDLTTFGSGSSVNANGSGFNLTAPASIKFENGSELVQFNYRTGTWVVGLGDINLGHNAIQVIHVADTTRSTDVYEYLVDSDNSSIILSAQTLDNLSMSGLVYLSGVKYHTSGTFDYSATVSFVYVFTYSTDMITFNEVRCTLSNINIANNTDPTDSLLIDETGTISTSSRILGQDISITTTVPKTLGRGDTAPTISDFDILLDPFTSNTTGTNDEDDTFNTESYRVNNNLFDNDTNLRNVTYSAGGGSGGSPFEWDSSQNIFIGISSHNNGLLQYNGRLVYPNSSQVINSGNFSTIVDGPTLNANYSLVTGNKTYLRYFFYTGDTKSNFSFKLTRDGTTGFNTVASGPSGQDITVELLLPNGTTDQNGSDNTTGSVEFKDASVAFSSGSEGLVGCGWDSNKSSGHDFGVKFGTRGTHMSGGAVVVRITASSSWTGYIDSLELNSI